MAKSISPTVVCPLDFSEGSESALIQAIDFVGHIGGRVHLFHADPSSHYDTASEKRHPSIRDSLAARVREFATGALGSAEALEDVGPEIGVISGRFVGDAIIEYADEVEAQYLVMGTHGRRGFRQLIIGSIAADIIRRSNIPVLVVPHAAARTQPGPEAPILVPIDFSDHSRAALIHAKALASAYSAELVLVHVLETTLSLPGIVMPGGLIPVNDLPTLLEYAHDQLRKFDEEAGGRTASGYHTCSGRAHREISDYAESISAGLIVMATHGLTGIRHALVGSVTERTLRQAKCSVLAVPVEEVTGEGAHAG